MFLTAADLLKANCLVSAVIGELSRVVVGKDQEKFGKPTLELVGRSPVSDLESKRNKLRTQKPLVRL